MTSPKLIFAALLLGTAGPIAAAAPPAARTAADVADRRAVQPVERLPDIPGVLLIGMAVSGLMIVGVAARRRQPGRSVSS